MILDHQLIFSDKQAVTASAISTNQVDRGENSPALTNMAPALSGLWLVIKTGTAFTGLTSLEARLVSDSVSTLNATPTVHTSTGAIALANLPANKIVAILPVPIGEYERFLGVSYVVSGTGTAGTVSAFLTRDPQAWSAMQANNPAVQA